MGLLITSNIKKCDIELEGGYGILVNIREEIANRFDTELGKHYSNLKYLYKKEDFKKWDEKLITILKDKRFKEEDSDIIEFLLMPDCEGHINYRTCKKLYDLLKDAHITTPLRYLYYSNNDWEDLKELLHKCYSHRANLIWR